MLGKIWFYKGFKIKHDRKMLIITNDKTGKYIAVKDNVSKDIIKEWINMENKKDIL